MIGTTVRRHRREVFNYFDAPYTSAFAAGLNSVMRAVSDVGRGCDFDILWGKVLLSAGRTYEVAKPDFDFENPARGLLTVERARHADFVRKYGIPLGDILEQSAPEI